MDLDCSPEEPEKYEINSSRDVIIWDPEKCNINDVIAIADYLLPLGTELIMNKSSH